jgi:hypothetical protein
LKTDKVKEVKRKQIFPRTGGEVQSSFKGAQFMTDREEEVIRKLAEEAEAVLVENCEKKDLKEKRGVTKNSLYDGSKKLKHSIPKGKNLK